ncbi:MAG: hypothetical protein Q6363_010755 [Candidatus Njordarchaeota archaeon]
MYLQKITEQTDAETKSIELPEAPSLRIYLKYILFFAASAALSFTDITKQIIQTIIETYEFGTICILFVIIMLISLTNQLTYSIDELIKFSKNFTCYFYLQYINNNIENIKI